MSERLIRDVFKKMITYFSRGRGGRWSTSCKNTMAGQMSRITIGRLRLQVVLQQLDKRNATRPVKIRRTDTYLQTKRYALNAYLFTTLEVQQKNKTNRLAKCPCVFHRRHQIAVETIVRVVICDLLIDIVIIIIIIRSDRRTSRTRVLFPSFTHARGVLLKFASVKFGTMTRTFIF